MPVDKVSIQKFAQTIKENHPEYKDIDDTALTNAIIQKYPQYKETVDLGQPEVSTDKKKDVGASGFTNTPTQTVTPSTGLALKDFNDFSKPKSLLPYQGEEQPTVKQNNFGIGNLVSDHPIKSVQIKPLPNDVKTVDEIHNETLNNSSNIINSILNNPDKAIDNIVKTQREEKLKQMFSPDLSKEDINKAKDLQFNYLMKDASGDNTEQQAYKSQLSYVNDKGQTVYDPQKFRDIINNEAKLYPNEAPKIKSSLYVLDAQNRAIKNPLKKEAIVNNANAIQNGDLNYNIKTGELTKPTGLGESIYNSFLKSQDEREQYNYLASHSPGENLQYLENQYKNQDPDKPTPQGSGYFGHIGEALGGNLRPIALGAGVGAISGPLAPFTVAAANTPHYTATAYVASLNQNYQHYRDSGLLPSEAYEKADKIATFDAAMAGVQGAVQSIAGAKIFSEEPKLNFSPQYKNTIESLVNKGKDFIQKTIPEMGINASVVGQLEAAKNINANANGQKREISQGVLPAMMNQAMFEGTLHGTRLALDVGLAALGHNIAKGDDRGVILQNAIKQPEEEVNSSINNLVNRGNLTPEQGGEVKQQIDNHKEVDSKVAPHVENDLDRLKIQTLIKTREILKTKLDKDSGIDEAYHPTIKEEIQKINDQIRDISDVSNKPKPETAKEEPKPTEGDKSLVNPKNINNEQTTSNGKVGEQPTRQENGKEIRGGKSEGQGNGQQSSKENDAESQENQKIKGGQNALQKSSAGEILQRKQSETGSEGGERGRVESGQQGNETTETQPATKEGKTSGEKEVTGIKNEITERRRKELGLNERDPVAERKFGEVWEKAKEKIANGYDVFRSLVLPLTKRPRPLSDEENALLLHHQNTLEKQINDANHEMITASENKDELGFEAARNKKEALLDESQQLYNVIEKSGSENARGLASRRMITDRRYNLVNMVAEKRASANDGKPLTEEQQKEVEQQHKDIQEKLKAYEEKIKLIEEENKIISAENEILKAKKESKKESKKSKIKKTNSYYVKERKSILDEIKRKLKEARSGESGLSSVPVPYAKELIAIAPEVAKLMKSFVGEGIDKLEDVVSNIHEFLKNEIEGLKKKDINDILAGEYSKKQTQSDLQKRVNDLKLQAKLINRLEDLQNGMALKGEKNKEARNKEIDSLRKQINDFVKEQNKLNFYKSRIIKQTNDLNNKLKNKYFEPTKKQKSIVLDPEAMKLKADYENAKIKYKLGLKKDKLEKSSKLEKVQNAKRKYKLGLKKDKLEKSSKLEKVQNAERKYKLNSYKSRIIKETNDLNNKLKNKYFEPTKKPKSIVLDPEAMKLKADYENAKRKYELGLKKDKLEKSSKLEKVQNAFVKYERAFKLSNPITMGKLVMAGLTRMTTTPLEDAIGAGVGKLFPKLTKGAIGEGGGTSLKVLGDAYAKAFTKGMKDAAQKLSRKSGGKTELDLNFSDKNELPPEALDFFGQLHSATKAPIVRFAFERSLAKRMTNALKSKVDVQNPLVEASIAVDAYKDSQRAIFMQNNRVVSAYQSAIRYLEGHNSTKPIATGLQWLIPFVKVPTNIAAELGTNVYGLEVAAGKLIYHSFSKGIENIAPEEKDVIIRQIKKGSLGTAAMLIGYFNPNIFGGFYQNKEKRKPDDAKAGGVKIFGINFPSWFIEAPIFQAMQVGATVRRVKDTVVKGEPKGIAEGAIAGLMGLADHIPMVAENVRIGNAFKDEKERSYFLDELVKSTVVPSALEYLAKATDPEDKANKEESNFSAENIIKHIFNPENIRKPSTLGEHIKQEIPGLKETVPLKPPSKTGGRRQRGPSKLD